MLTLLVILNYRWTQNTSQDERNYFLYNLYLLAIIIEE